MLFLCSWIHCMYIFLSSIGISLFKICTWINFNAIIPHPFNEDTLVKYKKVGPWPHYFTSSLSHKTHCDVTRGGYQDNIQWGISMGYRGKHGIKRSMNCSCAAWTRIPKILGVKRYASFKIRYESENFSRFGFFSIQYILIEGNKFNVVLCIVSLNPVT